MHFTAWRLAGCVTAGGQNGIGTIWTATSLSGTVVDNTRTLTGCCYFQFILFSVFNSYASRFVPPPTSSRLHRLWTRHISQIQRAWEGKREREERDQRREEKRREGWLVLTLFLAGGLKGPHPSGFSCALAKRIRGHRNVIWGHMRSQSVFRQ